MCVHDKKAGICGRIVVQRLVNDDATRAALRGAAIDLELPGSE